MLWAHYATISYRLGGQKLVIDPVTEKIVGNEDAMKLFKREVPQAVRDRGNRVTRLTRSAGLVENRAHPKTVLGAGLRPRRKGDCARAATPPKGLTEGLLSSFGIGCQFVMAAPPIARAMPGRGYSLARLFCFFPFCLPAPTWRTTHAEDFFPPPIPGCRFGRRRVRRHCGQLRAGLTRR